MDHLPTGIVTFVFTDIEGSTRLLQQTGETYRRILEEHGAIVRSAIGRHDGIVVSTEGDSFFAVFPSPAQAVGAVADFQRELAGHAWPDAAIVRVRVGIHTGLGTIGGDNYIGLDVHRAARITSAGHGGQVLISQATAVLTEHHLPESTQLRSLGEHRLKDLASPEPLFQLLIGGLASEYPPIRSLGASPNNLPVQLTSFVGREEVEAISALLERSRLVTLTGPGGTGKTRLSLQVAAEMIGGFSDGVWFVPLAAITEPPLVTTAVGAVLGLQPSSEDPDQRLSEYLRGKDMLLVLDNFEQVLEGAPRVATWLQGAPNLKVLITSRAPLHVYGEQEFPVPALRTPSTNDLLHSDLLGRFESVALFVERARSVRPDFSLDERTGPLVAEVVSRLDGLPLAIELAAARVRSLGLEAIKERLSSRLGLLTGGARDVPERQRTLRNAIEWSYDLLDRTQRLLFERLGVFVGGFDLAQAEKVCSSALELEVFDGLTTLTDQSLLRPVAEPASDSRFFMLETIREYALERLSAGSEEKEIRARHAASYLALAEMAEPEFTRSRQRLWLDRAERDHDNLRAAFMWAVENADGATAQRLAGALWRFWQMRGYLREGRERAELALSVGGDDARSRMKALEGAGGLAYWQADMQAALDHYTEALGLAREIGDPLLIVNALYNISAPLGTRQGKEAAFSALDEGLKLATEAGDRKLIGLIYWGRGSAYYLAENRFKTEDAGKALVEYELAAEYLAGTGASYEIGWTERMLATVLLTLGKTDEAVGHLRTSLRMFVEAGDLSALPLHVADFADLALARGDYERALVLAGATKSLQAVSETRLLDIIENEMSDLGPAIEVVGRERAEKLLAEGQNLSVEQILELVRES
jgi:predicted ATPase/class 3 adenylate cyclase